MKTSCLLGMGLLTQLANVSAAEKELPNIVFVLVDDMGIGDIGCYYNQQKIQTPHLDGLASEGLLFMQHYSGSTVSAPSR